MSFCSINVLLVFSYFPQNIETYKKRDTVIGISFTFLNLPDSR
ncbi:MAG: hypothetical protein IKT48_03815 [Anaerotignum sp.]|nr:hypothetical protein [Anaerotignum sp.]MBR5794214.1 hypothetical protein [Anaerotignum sp.]